IIHGDKDDIIPIELGRQVFEAAKPPKSFYVIEGADHNNTYQVGGAVYFRRWAEFVQAALRAYAHAREGSRFEVRCFRNFEPGTSNLGPRLSRSTPRFYMKE
ncbi:MAG: alpha/beta hydrolase, partial [Nitrospirota bacterium]|nr:alpha/beta hydrolase [Nitrospirota bacterium]